MEAVGFGRRSQAGQTITRHLPSNCVHQERTFRDPHDVDG